MQYIKIHPITYWEEILALDGIQMTGKRPDWAYKGLSELQIIELRQSLKLNKEKTPITEESLCNNQSELVIRIIYSLWKKVKNEEYVELPLRLLCDIKTRLLLSNLFPLENTEEIVNPGFDKNEAFCSSKLSFNYLKKVLKCEDKYIIESLEKFGYINEKNDTICYLPFKKSAENLKNALEILNSKQLNKINDKNDFGKLDEDQINFLKNRSTVTILNASPGTGKTYVSLRRVKAHLKNRFDRVLFVSLAHKALANAEKEFRTSELNNQLEFETKTLASLKYNIGKVSPIHVIIDESSMISAESFETLAKLASCPTIESFTILGDIKQLGPISGTGCLLDSIENWFPNNKFTLKTCHRSSDTIFDYYMTAAVNLKFKEFSPDVNKIQIYKSPIIINKELDKSIYNMVREIDNWDSVVVISYTNETVNKVNSAVVANMVEKGLFNIHTSYHKEGWIYLEALEKEKNYSELSKYFYQSEKVICNSNTHEKMKNSETGIITKIYTIMDNKKVKPVADIDCGYEIYTEVPLSLLKPAYALTVHKMQGSEADLVIYLHNGWKDPFNLAFTAASRAKDLLIIISSGINDRMKPSIRKTIF